MDKEPVNNFLNNITMNINDLDKCIEICEQSVSNEDAEISVIAGSLLRIFKEIEEYIKYFKSEIVPRFGLLNEDEWGRVQKKVFEKFVETVEEGDKLRTYNGRLELVRDVTQAWLNCPKDYVSDAVRNHKDER